MLRRTVAVAALCVFASVAADARPARWCGWFARFNFVANDSGPEFNQACAWRHYGTHADGPAVGALVIWCSPGHHHVGKIVGTDANGNFVVRSGNDHGAVRTRARSVAGAVFRWPQ